LQLANHNGIEVADLHTNATTDAGIGVNEVGLFPFASNGVHGTVAGANRTAGAAIGQNFIPDQRAANFGRAALLANVSFVLIAEEPQRAFNRIGRTLSQTAQAVSFDLSAQHF